MAENDNDMTTPQDPIAPATPLPATAVTTEKDRSVRNYVLAGVSGVVGVLLFLGAGVIGYAIGQHDSDGDNYRGGELAVSADRGGPQGEGYEEGYEKGHGDEYGMKGHDDEYGMNGHDDEYGMNGGMGGNRNDGMVQGNGIEDFLNQLQGGEGLTPDQQQFLDQLKGFVGGMRNQMS